AQQRRQARAALYFSRIAQSQLYWRVNDFHSARVALEACRPAAGHEDRRGWEWYYLRGLYQADLFSFSHQRPGDGGAVAYSPRPPGSGANGAPGVLASVVASHPGREGPEGELRVWDAATGRLLRAQATPASLHRLAFSPDGSRIALAGADGSAVVRDAATGRTLLRWEPHPEAISCMAYSPDGKRLATGSWDRTLKVLDAQTGAAL